MGTTSEPRQEPKRRRVTRGVALGAVVALLATALTWLVITDDAKRVTAYFTTTVGLYPESDVRVLGVVVGTVDAVEPQGERVRVSMSLDPDVAIPADAGALIVTPSLVSDRYVQLAPVYDGGPRMADDAVIDVDRTVVPVEIDELLSSLDEMTTALGPDGANGDGALSELLRGAAGTLDGNGERFGDAIRELGKAARTLAGSESDLFKTIDGLQKFTTMLAENDGTVREFNELLARVSEVFATERRDFSAAMKELSAALARVDTFVRDNRADVKANVDKLASTARVLAKQRDSLSEALDEAPKALRRLLRAYDAAGGSIDSRVNLNEFSMRGNGSDD
ncbi:MCE family protein [Haloechinothrix salitolerans]|uniref:MCE family protein n=1 Tax=Haloechinothrix salitolerans TaxID=926830 RepID=A0ABW2C623_9PSEU